jgi:hypothetical protein
MKRSRLLTAFVLVAALAGCSHKSHATTTPPAPTASTSGATSAAPSATAGAGAGHTAPPSSPTPRTESTKSGDVCTGGTIAWGAVVKPYVLTRVSIPFTVYTGRETPAPPMSDVTTVAADVKAGPQVPDMTVYRAFTAKVGVDPDVVLLGEVYDGATVLPKVSTLSAGKYVAYNGVRAAQATFLYTCGGFEYEGFVSAFLSAEAGTVKCGSSAPTDAKADGVAAWRHCR